jgi:hypothetical protein
MRTAQRARTALTSYAFASSVAFGHQPNGLSGATANRGVREPVREAGTPRLDADVDWPLVEDRIARSWELTAPRRLLEAGGR